MSADDPDLQDEEASVGEPLERGLRRRPLSADALARVRTAVEAELIAATARAARRRRFLRVTALAACVAVLAVAAVVALGPTEESALVGSIAQAEREGLRISSGLFGSRAAGAGTPLHAGERWDATGSALITLAGGGQIRIAPETVIEASERDHLSLRTGRAYLDFPPHAGRLVLHTARGYIEHLGTQFEVITTGGDVRVRVREGAVTLHTADGTEVTQAGMELFVPQTGVRERRPIPTYGRDWGWVEALTPRYDIEDRSVADFLTWVARETGRHVDFVDERTRNVAAQTRLHGSIRTLQPLEALSRVLETTSLRFDLHEDAIRVSSGT